MFVQVVDGGVQRGVLNDWGAATEIGLDFFYFGELQFVDESAMYS